MTPSPGGTKATVLAALSAAVCLMTEFALCRAVLLMTKRDLADLCLEGLLESTEQQQQTQLAALLQVWLMLSWLGSVSAHCLSLLVDSVPRQDVGCTFIAGHS